VFLQLQQFELIGLCSKSPSFTFTQARTWSTRRPNWCGSVCERRTFNRTFWT